jgi:tetratricopeptide (TPR) repeat protein
MTAPDSGHGPDDPELPSIGPSGPAKPSPEVEALLEKALDLAAEGAWEGVAELLREGLPDHPEDPYLLCWLGLAERELGMEGVAYERFKRSLAADPRDPVLLATAGNALAAFDDPAAEAALRTAALIAPGLPQARWMYGAYLAREGLLEEGLAELDAAVALDPEDPVIHHERGVALALLERMEEAEASFGRATELDDGDGWSLALLGLARLEVARERGTMEDEMEDVAPLLDEAARLRPYDLETQVLAALALAAAGQEDRALEMLERARVQAEGVDGELVLEVEDQMESGTALRFLVETLAPSSFRERLMQRP